MAPIGTVLLARPPKKAVANNEALLSDERQRSDLAAFESDPFAESPWTKSKRRRGSRNSGSHQLLNYEMARSCSEDSKQDSLKDVNSREDFSESVSGPGVLLLTFAPSQHSDTDNSDKKKHSTTESSTISTKSKPDERKIAMADQSSKENSSVIIWKGRPPKDRNLDNPHGRTRQGLRSSPSDMNKRAELEASREQNFVESNKITVKTEHKEEKSLQGPQDLKTFIRRSRSTACNEKSFEIIPKRDSLSADVVSTASQSGNSVSEDSTSKEKIKDVRSNEDSKPMPVLAFQVKRVSSTSVGYAPIGLTRAPSTIVGPGQYQLKDRKWGKEAETTRPSVTLLKTPTMTLPSPPLSDRTSSYVASEKDPDKGQQEEESPKRGKAVPSLSPKVLETRDSSNTGKTSTTSDVQSTLVAHTREPIGSTVKAETESWRKQQPKTTHVESVKHPLMKTATDNVVGNPLAREEQSRLLSGMNSNTEKSSSVAQSTSVGDARESNSNTVKAETETQSVQPPTATRAELVKQPSAKASEAITKVPLARQRRSRFLQGMTTNTEKPETTSTVQSAPVADAGNPNGNTVKAQPREQSKATPVELVKQPFMKASENPAKKTPARQERSRLLLGMGSRRDKIPTFLEIPGCAHGSLSAGSTTDYSSTTGNEENSITREEREPYHAKEVVEIVVAPLPSSQSASGRAKVPQRSLLDKEEERSTLSPRTLTSRVSFRGFRDSLQRMRSNLSIRGKRGKDDISETSVSLATTGARQRRKSWFRKDDGTESGMSLATTESTTKKRKWFWFRRKGKGAIAKITEPETETETNSIQAENDVSRRCHTIRAEGSDEKRTMMEDFFEAFTKCHGMPYPGCPARGHALRCVDDTEMKLEDSDGSDDRGRTSSKSELRKSYTHDSDSEDDYVCY